MVYHISKKLFKFPVITIGNLQKGIEQKVKYRNKWNLE